MVGGSQHRLSASQELFPSQRPTVGQLLGLKPCHHFCHSRPVEPPTSKDGKQPAPVPNTTYNLVFALIHSPVTSERKNQGQSRDTRAPAIAGLNSPSLPKAHHKSRPTISRGHEVYHFASPDITLHRIETPLPDENRTGQHPAPTQSASRSLPWGGSRPSPSRMQQSRFINCRKRHTHTHPSTLTSVLLLRCPRRRHTLA